MKAFWAQVITLGGLCFVIGIRFAEIFGPRRLDYDERIHMLDDRIHMLHERVSRLEDLADGGVR